jgi:hypothetical protein
MSKYGVQFIYIYIYLLPFYHSVRGEDQKKYKKKKNTTLSEEKRIRNYTTKKRK